MYVQVCVCVCMYVCMYVHVCVYTYVPLYVYVCMFIIYIYIYINNTNNVIARLLYYWTTLPSFESQINFCSHPLHTHYLAGYQTGKEHDDAI